MAAGDEGLAAGTGRVAVCACEVELGGFEAEGIGVAGGRDGVVFLDWWAPVDEVWGDGRVGWEGEVVVTFVDKGSMRLLDWRFQWEWIGMLTRRPAGRGLYRVATILACHLELDCGIWAKNRSPRLRW